MRGNGVPIEIRANGSGSRPLSYLEARRSPCMACDSSPCCRYLPLHSFRVTGLADIASEVRAIVSVAGLRPYQQGLALAKGVRRQLRLSPDCSTGGLEGLATLFGAPGYMTSADGPGQLLGFQACDEGVPTVVVGRGQGDAPVFALARGIGDHLAFGSRKAPISDIHSDRQAVGRAFAAEMLAPSEAVVAMIQDGQGIQRVARHFGTSTWVVRHQFGNNADRRH